MEDIVKEGSGKGVRVFSCDIQLPIEEGTEEEMQNNLKTFMWIAFYCNKKSKYKIEPYLL